jgi:Cu/Ag efflux pump CusA
MKTVNWQATCTWIRPPAISADTSSGQSAPSRSTSRCPVGTRYWFFIIFMLLYMTFHSASEATIVMLSVVYAMTGGVILQWLLGMAL